MTPTREMSPNGRVHWRTQRKAQTTARTAAKYATLDAVLQASDAAAALQSAKEVKIVWTVKWEPRRKTQDADNLIASLKPFLDGMCDTLAINDRKVRVLSVKQERDPDGVGHVAATLMPVGEDQP